MNRKVTLVRWKNLEKKWLTEPRFHRAWAEFEPEYQLARSVIKARLKKGITQAQLAKKLGTKQPVISRLESLNASPSLRFLKKLAKVLDTKLEIRLSPQVG